jgi:hypothetical protein
MCSLLLLLLLPPSLPFCSEWIILLLGISIDRLVRGGGGGRGEGGGEEEEEEAEKKKRN